MISTFKYNIINREEIDLTENEIKFLIKKSKKIFESQPVFLELEPPLTVCGDIHGQYKDLLKLFKISGAPPSKNYIFLGDYVDRGKQSIECICLLLCYKIKYNENFFLLRGNHECASINRVYGFFDECKRRYSIKLWKSFVDLFNVLPISALIDDKVLLVHGGLSPELKNINQLKEIVRPTDIPDDRLLNEWSDPETTKEDREPGANGKGVNILAKFLDKNELDLLCRAHKVIEEGYEFFGDRQLVTIFSGS